MNVFSVYKVLDIVWLGMRSKEYSVFRLLSEKVLHIAKVWLCVYQDVICEC